MQFDERIFCNYFARIDPKIGLPTVFSKLKTKQSAFKKLFDFKGFGLNENRNFKEISITSDGYDVSLTYSYSERKRKGQDAEDLELLLAPNSKAMPDTGLFKLSQIGQEHRLQERVNNALVVGIDPGQIDVVTAVR